jgi:hypothetical protein
VVQILLPGRPPPPLAWRGTVCLTRAAYAQLTEGGPLPELPRRLSARSTGSEVVLADQALGWAVALAGDLAPAARVTLRAGRAAVSVPLSPGGRLVALGLGPDPGRARAAARRLVLLDPDAALERALARWRDRWAGWPRRLCPLDPVARRGVAYVLACCAIPVGGATCLVTDHRILPLAWTRDGYFAARALLAWTTATRNREPVRLVRRHLAWLFEVADRPEGWWARSHLVGGQRKDHAFQLDQQLYPLLELADYVELTAEWPLLERYRGAVERVLQAIEGRKAAGAALYATEETPADDPLHFPYQTACQLLAWYTLMRLDRLGVGCGRLGRLARSIRDAVRRHQVLADSAPSRYAYATDLTGGKLDYHDANDLPMALAPTWGVLQARRPRVARHHAVRLPSSQPRLRPGPARRARLAPHPRVLAARAHPKLAGRPRHRPVGRGSGGPAGTGGGRALGRRSPRSQRPTFGTPALPAVVRLARRGRQRRAPRRPWDHRPSPTKPVGPQIPAAAHAEAGTAVLLRAARSGREVHPQVRRHLRFARCRSAPDAGARPHRKAVLHRGLQRPSPPRASSSNRRIQPLL